MSNVQSTTHYDPPQLFGSFQSFRQSCNNFLLNAVFIGIIKCFFIGKLPATRIQLNSAETLFNLNNTTATY